MTGRTASCASAADHHLYNGISRPRQRWGSTDAARSRVSASVVSHGRARAPPPSGSEETRLRGDRVVRRCRSPVLGRTRPPVGSGGLRGERLAGARTRPRPKPVPLGPFITRGRTYYAPRARTATTKNTLVSIYRTYRTKKNK